MSKKDAKIEQLESDLKLAQNRAESGRILSGKMYSHLIEINKWLADLNGIDRHYGGVDSHIDFNNRMISTIRNKLKDKRAITVTIKEGD